MIFSNFVKFLEVFLNYTQRSRITVSYEFKVTIFWLSIEACNSEWIRT